MQWYVSQALLYGNALAIPEGGQLKPVPWPSVRVLQDEGGALLYDVIEPSVDGRVRPTRRVRDVLHLRDRSDDGIVGPVPPAAFRRRVLHAQLLADAASAVYANGVTPSLAITVEGRLSPVQREALRAELREEVRGRGQPRQSASA